MDLPFLRTDEAVYRIQQCRFQSLFLWIFRSYVEFYSTKEEAVKKFQSLFLWIFRSYKLIQKFMKNWKIIVSILVLMDLPFLLKKEQESIFYTVQVSILVLMDLPFLHAESLGGNRWGFGVSILVLMDLPFLQ